MPRITGELTEWATKQVERSKWSYYITAVVDDMRITFFDKDAGALSDYLHNYSSGDYVTVDYTQKGKFFNGNYMIKARRIEQTELPKHTKTDVSTATEISSGNGEAEKIRMDLKKTELLIVIDKLDAIVVHAKQAIAYLSAVKAESG